MLLPYDGHEWSLDLDIHIQLHDVVFVHFCVVCYIHLEDRFYWCIPGSYSTALHLIDTVWNHDGVAAYCSIACGKGKVYSDQRNTSIKYQQYTSDPGFDLQIQQGIKKIKAPMPFLLPVISVNSSLSVWSMLPCYGEHGANKVGKSSHSHTA